MKNNNFEAIQVPQLGTNDTTAILVEKLIGDNELIKKGQVLCLLETTKATFDVISTCEGYVDHLFEIGDEVVSGGTIALVSKSLEKIKENKNIYKKSNSIENDSNDEPMATKKAIKLAEKLKIEISNINVDGIVKADVQNFFQSNVGEKSSRKLYQSTFELIGNKKVAKDLMLQIQ